MTDENDQADQIDQAELQAPPLVFPGQGHESAYRVAHDLLARRAPREALEVIEPALEADPGNTGLRSLRAWAFLLRAQLQRAEEELRGLVEENPDDDWARHALGRSLERQSRFADALPHLRLAAAMSGDPEHEVAVLRVERRLAEIGEASYDELR
ncbi:tetratricopeptide repeat protein [Nocardioides ferulae]|uniref:tetratricopeptide repeat protein n=1 Tax=Nocardioides ferulae TaxID=2340821 RepID=UPI001981892B|nr:tetratricopeptide repeat protein [Nocardioides ferulae]